MQQRRPPFRFAHPRDGLTLVEILVALAVLGVIAAVAGPSLADMMERRRVIAATGELTGILNFAKSEANVLGETLLLHLEPMPASENSSCARLVTLGTVDLCRCDMAASTACKLGNTKLLREYLLPTSTGVSFSVSPGSLTKLSFTRDTPIMGTQGFGLTVTGRHTGAQLHIDFNSVGRVHSCSPGGSIGGFPVC